MMSRIATDFDIVLNSSLRFSVLCEVDIPVQHLLAEYGLRQEVELVHVLQEFWPFFWKGIARMGVRSWREPIQLETRERICKFTTSVRVWTRLSVTCFAVRATRGCIACAGTTACFCHTEQTFNVCGCSWRSYEELYEKSQKQAKWPVEFWKGNRWSLHILQEDDLYWVKITVAALRRILQH